MNRYTTRFNSDEVKWLEAESGRRGIPVSEIIRQALHHEMVLQANAEKLEIVDARLQKIEETQEMFRGRTDAGLEKIWSFLSKWKTESRGAP